MRALVYGLLAAFLPVAAWAQDVTGQWQGAFQLPAMQQRFVLQIEKGADGALAGSAYLLEPLPRRFPVTGLALQDSQLRFAFGPGVGATFEGTLSPDGQTAAGTLTQGTQPRALTLTHASGAAAWVIDPSPHTTRRVVVDKDASLEVLDWGGSGPPLVFLAGLGGTAHVFDKLALRFTATHHVYAITRRGFGESSAPEPTAENYTASRLGDDVVAVIDALNLTKPVLAGHSLAGEELSAIANRHPGKVAGLVYLDAGYTYALYAPGDGPPPVNLGMQLPELLKDLDAIREAPPSMGFRARVLANLSDVQKDITALQEMLRLMPPPPTNVPPPPDTLQRRVGDAIIGGTEKFTAIDAPVLALFATEHVEPPNLPPEARPQFESARDHERALVDAFEARVPKARVVRLPGAQHALWLSHEEDVVREMSAFMAGLR